ncbi:unnamed protein product [Owenia fusiformis]|uniref:Sorting nexin-14-like n=2 Tax=Owenia fusiformis TaxID=6347 RepID=A0A8S4PK67_OWEFU|nr:unnamed protein product [Owenia fusiformis]
MADIVGLIQQHVKFSSISGVLLLCSLLLYSYLHFIMVLWSFIAGIAVCYFVFNTETLVPNLLLWHVRQKKNSKVAELSLTKKTCPVCGSDNCGRHRPELNLVALQPWHNLKIPERVDEAIEEFLNLVLKNFVYTWYQDLSEDEAFVDDMRASLRFIVAVFLRRAQKIDIPTLITDKLMRHAIRHLDCHLQARKKAHLAGYQGDLQQATLDFYGPHLHCAMRNRKTELDYLRKVSEAIFPYILPPQSLHCQSLLTLLREIFSSSLLLPAMDVIADPDTVNNLLLVFFDDTPPPPPTEPPSKQWTILANFAQPRCKRQSSLRVELADILNNQDVLFPFMQFLKSEASVNVLQFCLSVEDFNHRILNPELSSEQTLSLHTEAKEIYRMYCNPNAVDKIMFDDDIIEELREITEGPPEGVVKLRTTTPLFRAYEHAYNLLENTFLPLFHQSDDYYTMLCGDRLQNRISRSSSSKKGKTTAEPLTLSRLGSKIKGVFKSTTVEGALVDNLAVDDADEPDGVSIASGMTEDEVPVAMIEDDGPLRDLSTWRVSIPHVEGRLEPDNPKKQFYVFVIEVNRVDVAVEGPSHWFVDRRYNEFYALEQKMSEFHGEFLDFKLPTKKQFGTKAKEFLETRKQPFEEYLKKLLTRPELKGSELLHNFLTSENQLTTSLLPDINIGKMFKSTAMILIKEKGQHLDSFIQSFINSTEAPKPRPGKLEDRDSDTVSISSEKLANPMYEDNASLDVCDIQAEPRGNEGTEDIEGAFDTILFAAKNVFQIKDQVHHLLITARMLVKHTLENYLDWYIGFKLEQVTQEHRVVSLIHLLRDLLFFDDDPSRTDEQKLERKNKTFAELKKFLPGVLPKITGEEEYEKGCKVFFDLLQYPKLNKQLSYVLLDILLLELFPELNDDNTATQ